MSSGFNGLDQCVNVLTLADLTLRYTPKLTRSLPPLRQCIFNQDESSALIRLIEEDIKKAKEVLEADHGIEPEQLMELKDQLGDFDLQLKDEESLLASRENPRILHFRKTQNMKTDLEGQRSRLELLSAYTNRFYVNVLSASQAARAQNKVQRKPEPFEDELPPVTRSSFFRSAKAWFWGSPSPSSSGSDVESQTGQSDGSDRVSAPPMPTQEMNVQVTKTLLNEQQATGACRVGIQIDLNGYRYIAEDCTLRTREEAESLISSEGLAAIAAIGFNLAQQGSITEGVHRLVRNSLSGQYDFTQSSPEDSAMVGID